ncbi:MAG: T9SS type A sorting domain-containing protein [Sphingobacteriaceae bacterium]|nr:T9SS type A sorting domain-containing protein [Sphingobacteriaceae bacterium]
MKKIYTLCLSLLVAGFAQAASFTISISGTMYTPASSTVNVGDVITIQASTLHPLVEVDQTTYNANGTTSLNTGFGVKTADYTFTVSTAGTLYFVCQVHASMGMKGSILVNPVAGLKSFAISNQSFDVFPNPAKESFSVKLNHNFEQDITIKLFDILGAQVAELTNQPYSTAKLADGVYFVVLQSNNQSVSRKIVVSK